MGIAAIEEMVVSQREKIDWVVVELTGLADPGESMRGSVDLSCIPPGDELLS